MSSPLQNVLHNCQAKRRSPWALTRSKLFSLSRGRTLSAENLQSIGFRLSSNYNLSHTALDLRFTRTNLFFQSPICSFFCIERVSRLAYFGVLWYSTNSIAFFLLIPLQHVLSNGGVSLPIQDASRFKCGNPGHLAKDCR